MVALSQSVCIPPGPPGPPGPLACVDLRKRAHLEEQGIGVAAIQHGCFPNLAGTVTKETCRKNMKRLEKYGKAGFIEMGGISCSDPASFMNIKPEPGGSGMNSPVISLAYISSGRDDTDL